MIRPHRAALVAAVPFVLLACDGGGLEVVPEIDRTFGFESGLAGWVPVTEASAVGSATAEVSAEEASAGSSSVRLAIDDLTGTGAALITRSFELEPGRSYDVDLVFDFGTSDGGALTPWQLRAAATPTQPGTAGLQVIGSTGGSSADLVFEGRTAELVATASPEGTLFVTLGVTQATPGARVYFLDEVQVVLTRR